MNVSDISTFFKKSTRAKNDATNAIRERVLKILHAVPQEYLDNAEFGKSWLIVQQEWDIALKKIAEDTSVPSYNSVLTELKGGRGAHHDITVSYCDNGTCVASRNVEFKNGGTTIESLPQFLSLQVRFGLFTNTYDKFFHEEWLDKYIACDTGITEEKPALNEYLKLVVGTTYSIHPFFEQLKLRETVNKTAKAAIVNKSITDYLTKEGATINTTKFAEKVKSSQNDKMYLLWSNSKFHLDTLSVSEMPDMKFHSIKKGNVLQLASGNTMYGLLLRWRNHKGILNPAWQITMKRISTLL